MVAILFGKHDIMKFSGDFLLEGYFNRKGHKDSKGEIVSCIEGFQINLEPASFSGSYLFYVDLTDMDLDEEGKKKLGTSFMRTFNLWLYDKIAIDADNKNGYYLHKIESLVEEFFKSTDGKTFVDLNDRVKYEVE